MPGRIHMSLGVVDDVEDARLSWGGVGGMNLDCKREIDGKFVNPTNILINPYKKSTTQYIFLSSLYSDGRG